MRVGQLTTTLFLAASLIGATADEPDWRKTFNPITPHDEVRVIVQVCLSDKTVSFEEVEVDLVGTPKATTMREAREANGYKEAVDSRRNLIASRQENDPDAVTVRRWAYSSEAGQLKRSFLGFGEILNRNRQFSASADHIYLWSNSERNQPIYEKEGHPINETIALDVSAEIEKDGKSEIVTYWFKPPKEIPTNRFTNWQNPISQETAWEKANARYPTFWNLTHEREMELHPVDQNAPKIRYRLMTVEDYYNKNRFWKRAQKAVAEKYYRGVTGKEREARHFVPRSTDSIPGC